MTSFRRLFFLILVVGIAVRFFVAAALPDSALSDTLYHLSIAKHAVETGFFPFNGLELFEVSSVPPALYHSFVASVLLLTGKLTAASATALTLVVSAIQLLVAFILLKKLFPKNWVYGMAFFTFMPLVTKYAGVNYIETFASIFVLFSFYLYILFRQTGQRKFLLLGIFSLAAMSMAKLSATVVLPAFLFFFAWEMRKKAFPVKGIALFAVIALALSGMWFAAEYSRTGKLLSSNTGDLELLVDYPARGLASVSGIGMFFVDFNASFWGFPPDTVLFGVLPMLSFLDYEVWRLIFLLFTFPLLLFSAWFIAKSAMQRKQYSWLLVSVLALAFIVVLSRSINYVHARMFLPVMPLLAIPFAEGFGAIVGKWRKIVALLAVIAAVYAFANVSFFAFYYNSSFQKSAPLYAEIALLPEDSLVIIPGNYVRAVRWFAERNALGPEQAFRIPKVVESFSIVQALSKQEIYSRLKELNVTHLVAVCSDNSWNMATIAAMEQDGMLHTFFEHGCSKLFEVK